MKRFALISLLALTSLSCTSYVYEAREACQATLVFKAEPQFQEATNKLVYLSVYSEIGTFFQSATATTSALNKGVVLSCDRAESLSAMAVYGWPSDNEWNKGGKLVIPDGQMCPEAGGAFIEMDFPTVKEEITPIPLSFRPLCYYYDIIIDGLEERVYTVTVECEKNGYSSSDLELLDGHFRYEFSVSEGGDRTIRIPRIGEKDVLTVTIDAKDELTGAPTGSMKLYYSGKGLEKEEKAGRHLTAIWKANF